MNQTERLIDRLERAGIDAINCGLPEMTLLLKDTLHILRQFIAVTPDNTDKLTCQKCKAAGRVPKWFPSSGQYLDVLCDRCQGSGSTWNPHPNIVPHDIKAEM